MAMAIIRTHLFSKTVIGLLSFVLLLQRRANAAPHVRRPKNPRNDTDGGSRFPQVFELMVASDATLQDPKLVASLDILQVEECKDKEDWLCLDILVHSLEELEYLKDTNLHLKFNPTATQALYSQLTYDASSDHRKLASPYDTIPDFDCYRSLRGMETFLVDLVESSKATLHLNVTLEDIGDSYLKTIDPQDGHDIWALRITGNGVAAAGRTTTKGVFLALGGLHAREYAPPELLARWAELLVHSYGSDPDITSLLDHTEIHLILEANPDGRVVAETHKSLFRRKNVNPTNGTACSEGDYGVDLNRNFPFMFGLEGGSSGEPCTQTFRGSAAASEPETAAIVAYAQGIFPEDQRPTDPVGQRSVAHPETNLGVFLDVHSYGECVIFPWGHQNKTTGNTNGVLAVVHKYRHFNGYNMSGPHHNFHFIASGATDDWAFGTLGTAANTLELGTAFYQDCPYFEDSIVPGNLPLLTYAASISRAPFVLAKGPDVTDLSLSSESISNSFGTTSVTISITVSDTAWSAPQYSTAQQSIQEIRIYVNVHPDDFVNGVAATPHEVLVGNDTTSSTRSVDYNLDTSEWSLGWHTIYVQGMDSDGYLGPVRATWLEVTSSATIRLDVVYDEFASQLSWRLVQSDIGLVVARSGSLLEQPAGLASYQYNVLPGSYTFEMEDAQGDGLLCDRSLGRFMNSCLVLFQHRAYGDRVLAISDGKFGASYSVPFTVT